MKILIVLVLSQILIEVPTFSSDEIKGWKEEYKNEQFQTCRSIKPRTCALEVILI